MSNQVSGPYVRTSWVDGSTAANQTNMNNLEKQASVALNGFNGDLLTAFVLSGITCTKDGTVANQLDIASGRAYVTMSDGTRGLIVVGADNTHTTSALSSTYHLYLQNDGTWYWNTSNSPAANSLSICTVTTDGSGNILAVTDARSLNPSLLNGLAGRIALPALTPISVHSGSSNDDTLNLYDRNGVFGAAMGWSQSGGGLYAWDEVNNGYIFHLGTKAGVTFTGALQSIGGQASVGSFGAPVIVAQAIATHVTATTQQTILSYTIPAIGLYRVNIALDVQNGTSGQAVTLRMASYDPVTSAQQLQFMACANGAVGVQMLNGTNTFANNQYFILPAVTYAGPAGVGGQINVYYTDPANTPNDYVSVVIERLS